MTRTAKPLATEVLLTLLTCALGHGQGQSPTILEIDVANRVNYWSDVFDTTKFATDPTATTPVAGRNFRRLLQLSDIVAVNGKPAKGTHVLNGQVIALSVAPNPGQAIWSPDWEAAPRRQAPLWRRSRETMSSLAAPEHFSACGDNRILGQSRWSLVRPR